MSQTDNNSVLHMQNILLNRGEKTILSDVSWRIDPGQHWGLIGANGSGKTTLLRLACGYIWPTGGSIIALGEQFGKTDLRELRKKIGWVSSALAAMVHNHHKAMELVLSGPRAALGGFEEPSEAEIEKANALCEQFDITRIADTKFGALSAGEQQKVLIARALMSDPQLLILDEACAGLDLRARETLLGQIDDLAASGDMTLIFVTHHIEEISPSFTHVLMLDDGKVAASGEKDQLLNAEILSDVLKVDMTIDRHEGRYWPRMKHQPTPRPQ